MMEGKGEGEKSFRIEDLLQRKDDFDSPMELTTSKKPADPEDLSPELSLRARLSPSANTFSHWEPGTGFPRTPFPSFPLRPGLHHNPPFPGPPPFFPFQPGSGWPGHTGGNPDLSFWNGLGPMNPNFPNLSQSEFHRDPRFYEYNYPASSLLNRIACGLDYMDGRGLHPLSLFHGESKRKGGQIRFSNSQTAELEKAFVEQKYQNAHERRKLAASLGLTERQVKTWFQNRRAKWRKNGTGVKEDEALERSCHSTTNRFAF